LIDDVSRISTSTDFYLRSASYVKLKQELIRLGHTNPELRDTLTEVLNYLSSESFVLPLGNGRGDLRAASTDLSLRNLLSALQALYFHYQVAHWTCQGDHFYSDHLMYQRLYEGLNDVIDTLAEKILGYCPSSDIKTLPQLSSTQNWLVIWDVESDLISKSIFAEKTVLDYTKKLHDFLQKVGITLGMEDFLTSLSSEREDALYLLNRRKGNV